MYILACSVWHLVCSCYLKSSCLYHLVPLLRNSGSTKIRTKSETRGVHSKKRGKKKKTNIKGKSWQRVSTLQTQRRIALKTHTCNNSRWDRVWQGLRHSRSCMLLWKNSTLKMLILTWKTSRRLCRKKILIAKSSWILQDRNLKAGVSYSGKDYNLTDTHLLAFLTGYINLLKPTGHVIHQQV